MGVHGHELTMWHWVGVGERDRIGRSKMHSGSASPQYHHAHTWSWGTSIIAEMADGIARGGSGQHGEGSGGGIECTREWNDEGRGV